MEARRIYRGQFFDVWYLAEGQREFAREFVYGELTREQQRQIVALVQRMADHGRIDNIEQFRQLHGETNLYELQEVPDTPDVLLRWSRTHCPDTRLQEEGQADAA